MDSPICNPFLVAALEYAARGWHVGRTRPRTKHHYPGEYYAATIFPETLTRWWTEIPDANVNVSTGEISGLVSIDVDGEKGALFWNGIFPREPAPRIITPRGFHLLYRHDGPIASFNLHPEIDVCADDGQTMMPPSIHPSGSAYFWGENGSIPKTLPLLPKNFWEVVGENRLR